MVAAELEKAIRASVRLELASANETVSAKSIREAVVKSLGIDGSIDAIKSFVKKAIKEEYTASVMNSSSSSSAPVKREKKRSSTVSVDEAKSSPGSSPSSAKKKRNEKQLVLSWALAEFMGVEECGRPTVTKRLWAYIKEKELQDPKDRRKILLDDTLQKIFKRKTMTMFTMNKFLTPHMKRKEDIAGYEESEEEEEEEDEDPLPAKKSNKKRSRSKSSPKKKKKKKAKKKRKVDPEAGKGKGLRAPVGISSTLANFMHSHGEGDGVDMTTDPPRAARTDVTKSLWAYIREKGLQKPDDKRKILCDVVLKRIFKVDAVTMFSMNKYLSPHMQNKAGEWGKAPPKDHDAGAIPERKPSKPKKKNAPRGNTGAGFQKPVAISEVLASFMGSSDGLASRPQVTKKLWEHIKANDLQDPDNRREIICDDTLKTLFNRDTVNMFQMSKELKVHFV